MDAINLRSTPRSNCVLILCNIIVAAPIAISIGLGSSVLWRHAPVAVSTAKAEVAMPERPVSARPVIPSLPVPALPGPAREARVTEPVARLHATRGLGLEGDAFRADDGTVFAIEGIELPDVAARCRRLDGVELPCRDRLAARLEVLDKSQGVRCQITLAGASARGRCAAGKIDLADDLVRAGLARRVPQPARG